ncbi:very short patch repair endonuclease [Blastopirellula marina]|uniref:Very short patch repair endonuclease n=1 Tax=Blastopirellula marina TaxID=124 RepID=A0A2S8F2R1_9BACT|nr:DNA mismatch endonuclease Vsr [Blastopirellula marina]PQO26446.1 very short patch repair endonuclease [Blastopirellula marina]PQO46919.1 very short patch repair endonuclease [Blastopirellula marina]PTL40759.1 very short patch repair endonuclease [Blastopirellula marina]
MSRSTDIFDPETRSEIMRRVRSSDTQPERIVRSLAHRLGYRFRLGRRDLPGSPDLTFPGRRKVIFVHGCFWHQHRCAKGRRPLPKQNADYWRKKLSRNQQRDRQTLKSLRKLGWKTLIVWECETKRGNWPRLAQKLQKFLAD